MSSFIDKITFSVVPLKSTVKALRLFKIDYTFKRIWNLVKILSSMYVSAVTRRPFVWGLPPIVMFEPTNICNLKCPMCPAVSGKRILEKGKLELDNYKNLLDEIGPYIFQLQLWNQGEPFVHKDFLEMVRYAKEKGIMTITSTNAHFVGSAEKAEEIVNSGLDQLIISMDGTNQESYEKYRINGDFNLVIYNLKLLAKAKEKLHSRLPLIELQFIVFKHNQQEIDKIIELAKELHLNRLSFKSPMVYTAEQADTFLDTKQKDEMYTFAGTEAKRKKIPNRCKRLWLNTTVNWNGTVVPCCFDADSDHVFNNVFHKVKSFKKIWKSPLYKIFRKKVLADRSQIEICCNCTEGMDEPYAKIIELEDL